MLPFDIHTHQFTPQHLAKNIQSFSLSGTDLPVIPKENWISVGLHPWYTTLQNFENSFKNLESIAKNTNVKMIGECGLDKLRGAEIFSQIKFLEPQIELAESLKKPLILHCVKAFDELIALKTRMQVKVPMIIHGFNKNDILGEQLSQKGFYLSFGKTVLIENSNAAQLLKKLDHFFLETDNSDIAIEDIYRHVAILKNCTVEQLKERIFADWKKITDF